MNLGPVSPQEEDEEEEPKLKYQRLWGSLPEILAKENAATCLGVAEEDAGAWDAEWRGAHS